MIQKHFSKHKLIRQNQGTFTKGKWTPGATTELEIDALVRPKSTYELKREFEGRTIRAAIKIYSDESFEFGKKDSGPDFIEYNDDLFEVVSCWKESEVVPHVVSVGVLFME